MLGMTRKQENVQKLDFDVNQLIAAEEELHQLKQQYGIEEKVPYWKKCINTFLEKKEDRSPVTISKKKYCLTALFGGWLGIHKFMVGKKGQGMFYLLTCFTGISFTMSVMDVWYAAFLKTDETHLIEI